MRRFRLPSIFKSGPILIELKEFGEGFIDSVSDINAPDNSITGGRNVEIDESNKPKSRSGVTLYGNFIGETTGILGGFNFVNRGGTQEQLVVYDTGVYRYVSGTWTLLTGGATLTSGLKADGAYMPLTNKFYITNGTDNVQVYTSGGTIASDASFKKGKYVIHFQNRLLTANVSSQEDYVWYSDLGVDTFSANNYFRVAGAVTGLVEYYDKVLTFTKRNVYRLQNFAFDGTVAGPEAVITLPTDFGAIFDRTIVVVNNFVYFLGQDSKKKVDIYKCDGYKAVPIGDDRIRATLNSLSTAQLENACAVAEGLRYRVHVAAAGETTNNLGIVYDTARGIFHTPEERFVTGRADFSCLWSSETSGSWEIYAGTSGVGQVYKLDSSVDYDELSEERYLTRGTYNVPIDSNPAKRAAQSFKLSNYNATQTIPVSKVALLMKKNAGTTTNLTVRIETDNNGKPSGTAVTNGTATLTAFSDASYVWKTVSFATAPELTGSTTYWIVVQHATEGSGTSQYYWLGDPCSPTYTYGNLATYATLTTSTSDTFTAGSSGSGYAKFQSNAGPDLSWSSARSTTVDRFVSASFVDVDALSETSTDLWSELSRGILQFDTSSLPNDATITSAYVSLYVTHIYSNTGYDFVVTDTTTSSNTSLSVGDYNTTGTTRYSADTSIGSLTVNAYNNITLNASGISAISLTGFTKFAVRLAADVDGVSPTWASNTNIGFRADGSQRPNKPRLVITYSTPTGTGTWTSDPVTDQAFQVYSQSTIDAYFDTKALQPAGFGRRYKLHRFLTGFDNAGDYKVQVGFNRGEYETFKNFLINLAASETDQTWGGGGVWGSGLIWGGTQARTFTWTPVSGFEGITLKVRVRNRNPNEPFTFEGITLALLPKERLR